MKGILIIVAILGIAAAAFFGVRYSQSSKSRIEGEERADALATELEKVRAQQEDLERKAARETNARTMAEEAARKSAEAEARRLAQAQAEREAQEGARRRAEQQANQAAQDLDQIRADRARLEAEAQRLQELRTKESAEAERRLAEAKRALEEGLREKNAEIERQAALIAEYGQRGGTAPVKSEAGEESPASPETMSRVIFSPSNYKRANHYYMLRRIEAGEGN
jgi:FtsZ-interacting cell division protein ZipA